VTAGDADSPGLLPDDISWLLEHVAGEIIVIRPGRADLHLLATVNGHGRPKPRQARPWRTPHARRSDRPSRQRFGAPDGRGEQS